MKKRLWYNVAWVVILVVMAGTAACDSDEDNDDVVDAGNDVTDNEESSDPVTANDPPALVPPTLISPDDDMVMFVYSPLAFDWTDVEDAIRYEILFTSDDPIPGWHIEVETDKSSLYFPHVFGPTKATWQVRVIYADGVGPVSEARDFTTWNVPEIVIPI